MSYILDALKKSEAERAAQASARPAPELGPAQALSSGSRNRSLIPLLVVLVFMLFEFMKATMKLNDIELVHGMENQMLILWQHKNMHQRLKELIE